MKAEGGRRKAKGTAHARECSHFRLPPAAFRLAAAAAIVAALAACGSTSPRIDRLPGDAGGTPSRGGGYYLDDGPGANPPANLDSIPDAVPRIEPLHRGTMRPYTVMGRSYTPMTELAPYRARGIATWYGRRYHGRQTSSGEIYDMYGMTAAHTVLPIPSYARVTNVANGRSVLVRVNDRGPFIGDRLIDLSYAAAHRLGIVGAGSGLVEVVSVLPGEPAPEMVAAAPAASPPPAPATGVAAPAPGTDLVATPLAVPAPPPPAAEAAAPVPLAHVGAATYLQLGAFGSRTNAENYLARLRLELGALAPPLQIVESEGFNRVYAGPYASEAEARSNAERIGQTVGVKPLLRTR